MTITIIILQKQGDKIFDKENKTSNILILITGFLFITILIVHLFREQSWTADTLKILIGVLVGAGSAKVVDKRSEGGNSIDISGTSNGDIAGRDINKNIQNIEKAISDIQNSVVHQNNQIKQFVGDNGDNDYVINTIYERGEEIKGAIEKVINYWQDKGWALKHISSDCHGMDGMLLFFTKAKQNVKIKVHYRRSSDTNSFPEI
ncbi:hypothetical protein [Empedobacter falsenii]|uniref:hypothetical protein n=1 Tax=Empedobacter falsenii TaxID=343874 RepID=UPI002574F6EE|nr:hypothetical protein [Empedobacter falsenii]MDM1319359.1 hypothetical protein [Empedobacter falsenii]